MDGFGQPQEHSQLSVLGILKPRGIYILFIHATIQKISQQPLSYTKLEF